MTQGISFTKSSQTLWDGVSERQKEVLKARFGLEKSGKKETLEAIGKRYGVTRERVRQIESTGLKAINAILAKNSACVSALEKGKKYLKASGGVATEGSLIANLRGSFSDITSEQVGLLITASGAFYHYPADKQFTSFYYSDPGSLKAATQFINQWTAALRPQKEAVLTGSYKIALKDFLKKRDVSPAYAENYLAISKKIKTNPYGIVGLTEWPEINPRTIRDRIYLVLQKTAEPLHFTALAGAINEAGFVRKRALASTVHNELIKDTRFVLVGRGIYGLAEHGYAPGTAREVIHRILKNSGPLRSKDIVLAVQKERFFKYNTILVNLQNKDFFERSGDGAYRIRQA